MLAATSFSLIVPAIKYGGGGVKGAAGAMLFVISNEIIPESQKDKFSGKLSTHALLIGFVIMMFLDNVLG